jgi:hypothetical protein
MLILFVMNFKEFEVREYQKAQFVFIRIKNKIEIDTDKKSANKTDDPVTKHVWKIMKYTQGHNEAKQIFKIYLPIFVKIREYDDDITTSPSAIKEHIQEIKIMSCLAPEFQQNTGDSFPLPPKPIDSDIEFEIMDSFKCYVRYVRKCLPYISFECFKKTDLVIKFFI